MKLPDTGRKKALIVVDLQPAFIKEHNTYVIQNIEKLLTSVSYDAYIEAVFSAEKGSLWDTQQAWFSPKTSETHTVGVIHDLLKPTSPLEVHKSTRSVFRGDQDIMSYLKAHDIAEIHIVGTETNDCVLATAFDAFDSGFPVYVLEECCESATEGRHEMGVNLLRLQGMTNNSCLAHTITVPL